MTLRLYLLLYLEIITKLSDLKKIWLSPPHMGGSEFNYVEDAFKTTWIAPVGPHISLFEKKISEKSNYHSVAALSSGTAAIHLSLILLDIKNDDYVICPSFTFSASANPIKYVGAHPIFIDSEAETWNMCPNLLEQAIEDCLEKNKKPKAIIIVHLYGMSARIEELMSIAQKYQIPVIEDAAEALGSKYKNQPLGTFGKFGIFSFNGNKIITTSGGGALISYDNEMIERAKYFATQARDNESYYQHSNIGYNYRLSNICAAIGIGQLEVLDERVKQRRKINATYKKELSDLPEISFLEENKHAYSNYWLTTLLLHKKSNILPKDIILELDRNNIESRRLWKPMHLQPIFTEEKSYINGVSEELFKRGLCLPSGSNMCDGDVFRVIECVKKIYEK